MTYTEYVMQILYILLSPPTLAIFGNAKNVKR